MKKSASNTKKNSVSNAVAGVKKLVTNKKIKLADEKQTGSNHDFPIVAIGASAGGLEAMMELLEYLPADTGMAFIYVQHLSPDHKSMLTEILSRKTTMIVQEIDDMDKIKPDNVFVIPNNKGIEVTDGHIKLIPRSGSGAAISIDILFSSLAEAQKERVIGIILSGSASDGTAGIKVIKQQGGLTFAQDDTAKFTSMPHSAIAAGMVDFILSPKEIAHELVRLCKHPLIKAIVVKNGEEDIIENSNPDLKTILNQLHKATGVDFSAYKMNTIKRRIIRRMLLYKITQLKEYAKLLSQKNEEISILYQDLLINVTSFFRDTDTYTYLEENLFPKLLSNKKTGESLRIWVAACATGEEAYSIAMMLLEILENKTNNPTVQIFATDLSEQAIKKARIGIYTKQELETVSLKRIQRFFTKADDGFRVNKVVRDMCVFAPHNILQDPPFSRLDFISCCNLFIYLDNATQKKAVNTFHYALNDDGFLMLGKSENITQSGNLFTSFNRKYKIFLRKTGTRTLPALLPRYAQQTVPEKNIPLTNKNKAKQILSSSNNVLSSAIDAMLVAEFMPASVVINHQMEIVQFRGTTELFLTHKQGNASLNILKMARPELAFELRNAISKVIKTRHRFRKSGIEFKINSAVRVISLEIVPLEIESDEPLLLILFTEQEQTEIVSGQEEGEKNISFAKDRRIKKLEQELAAAHADALAFAQDQEAFTEELQSANEEIVSSNEELQTMNEELGTSKEETESANEELIITNQELQTRNDLLNESYIYSEAVVATMHNPMIFLDKSLRVKSASKVFYKNFKVTEEETEGVLLYDLGNRQWNIPRLRELLEDILPKNAHFHDFEITHTFPHIGERIMLLNASRIVHKTNHEELILLAFADFTDVRKHALEKSLKEKEALELQIETQKKVEEAYTIANAKVHNLFLEAPAIICVHRGPQHVYILSNKIHQQVIGNRDILEKPVRKAMPELEGTGIYELLDQVYSTGEPFVGNEFPVKFDRGNGKLEEAYFNFVYQPTHNSEGEIDGILVHGVDVSEQVLLRKKVEDNEKRYNMMLMQSPFAFAVLKGKDMVVTLANDSVKQIWGKGDKIEGKPLIEFLPEIKDQEFPALLDKVYTTGIPYMANEALARMLRNGKMEDVYFNFVYQPYRETDDTISGVTIIAIEVTELVEAKKIIEKSEKQLQKFFSQSPFSLTFMEGENFVYKYVNEKAADILGAPANEIIGKSMFEIIPEIMTQGFKEMLVGVLKTGMPFVGTEVPAIYKRGDKLVHAYFDFVYEPFYDITGKTTGVVSSAIDVTEKVLARKKIEENEKRKAFLLEISDALRPLNNLVDIEEAVTKIAMDFMGADWCHYCTIEGDNLIILRDAVRGDLPSVVGEYLISNYPLFNAILNAGHPFIVDDVHTTNIFDEGLKQLCVQLQNISFINVPIIKNGKPVGILSIVQSKPRKWTDLEVQLTVETAERTWAALEGAKAEENLRKSEEKYRTLFTSIDQGFALCELVRNKEGKGIDFYVLEVNPTYEKQSGASMEMVLGKTILQVFPALNKWWIETYAAVLDNQRPVMFERYFENTQRWFEINAYPVENDRFTVLFSDITERKQAEEKISLRSAKFEKAVKERTKELQEQKDFSETILNTTVDLIAVYDTEMRIISLNKECEDLFKIKLKDVKGKIYTDVFPSAKGGQGHKDLQRALSGETVNNKCYYSILTGRYYNNIITPLKNAAGKVYAAAGIARDMTESINAIEKIKQSEEKFSKLFECAPFGITLVEVSTGKTIEANENYAELTGYTREEIIGHTSLELKVIEKKAREIILEQHTNHGSVSNAEIEIRNKAGKIISVLVSIETITIGAQKYYLNAINDISERKKSEREIEKKNKDLENINKELESFSYVSSHDLQEPLRKLKNFVSCLMGEEKETISESGKHYLERIYYTAQRMQSLIDDLLTYSRLKKGEFIYEKTNLNTILNQVKDDLKETIQETGAVIEAQELCEVNIIPFQFRQLLNNLVGNALKFSRKGVNPHIVIKNEIAKSKKFNNHLLKDNEEKLLPNVSYCHISISDNGIGFDPQYNERIFEVFQRLHGQEQYKGTGIGLAICKKIVTNHNGIITATGKVNEGATFDIYLPAE